MSPIEVANWIKEFGDLFTGLTPAPSPLPQPELSYVFVDNQLSLQRALEKNKIILIDSPIAVNESLILNGDETKIVGLSDKAKIINSHRTSSDLYVDIFKVEAKNCQFVNLTIDGGHPLTKDSESGGIAIRIDNGVADTSGLKIVGCKFLNTLGGVWRWPGSTDAFWLNDLLIEDCHFYGFTHTAIHLNWRLLDTSLKNNRIAGRYKNQQHPVLSNAIWIGNYADGAIITENRIWGLDRHGIEYWNSQDNPVNTDGNRNAVISKNIIRNIKSFAISAFGNGVISITDNIIDGCSIGIETYNDKTNKGEFVVNSNFINNFYDQAISINNVENGLYSSNVIGEGNSPHAIQIINGGKDLKIFGNKFKNAGRFSVLINGKRLQIVGINKATTATITCSYDVLAAGFYVGKRIYIRDVVGMTQINKKYCTILSISGKTMQVDINTTLFNPYTSGGVVQERYLNISIQGNTCNRTKYSNGFTDGRTFYGYDYQNVVLKNNESYFKSSLLNCGGFYAANLASTYIDDSQNAVQTSGISQLLGSNLTLAIEE
jgi:hypothetical protein